MTDRLSQKQTLTLTLAAAAILLITMGVRQTSGLFLLPITQSTGVSIVAFSFALAVGQFVFGAAQPVFGVALSQTGTYDWIWYADIALVLLAAVVNLPIKEAKVDAQPVAA